MTTLLALSKTEEAFSKTERSEVQRRGSLSNRAKRRFEPKGVALEGRGATRRRPSDRAPPLATKTAKRSKGGVALEGQGAKRRRPRRPRSSAGTKTEQSEGLVPEEGVEPTRRVTGGRF